MQETDGLVYRLFETILLLMECFFQLPKIAGIENQDPSINEQERLLEALITRFLTDKNQYNNTIYVSYHLRGATSLKRWIKSEVAAAFQDAGLYSVEALLFAQPDFVRYVCVTNHDLPETEQATIVLSQIPDKGVIRQAISAFL